MRSLFPAYLPLLVIVIIVVARRPANMLRRRGAISPETAQRLDDLNERDRRRLDRLIASGVVREAAPSLYYHDVAAERARVRAKMPWLIGLAVILALVAIALGWYNAHHVGPIS
ncbi:MAG TPA: hypothetical protein VG432_01470 [Gemmatimonadaceae bacterium]|nr:hypothetical protein [Gemmatimonadaceae bacterium]